MRKLSVTLCLTVAVLLGIAGMSWGADFQKGLTAAKSGDYATALREWAPLAEQGYAPAQNYLGLMYEKGKGVPQGYRTAVKWYTLAAEQGDTDAQNNLGLMYEKGKGVPQDHRTAVKWYTLAAEQGDADGQGNLSAMYAFGAGVLKDYVYAHMWGSLAAANGNRLSGRLRADFARKMTPADISKAQDLARECVRKKYKGC